jgi:hypothetical protein
MMQQPKGDSGWAPSPELLAAYGDGELDGNGPCFAMRKRLEAWLADHPDAAASIEGQRRLAEWFRATSPPEPTGTAWAAVSARVQRLARPRSASTRARRVWLGVLGATAAAGLWLALGLLPTNHQHKLPGTAAPGLSGDLAEAFAVATAAEVEILSVQGEDTASLPVGELPVQGSLVLLEPGEVTLTSVEPTQDNMVPAVRTGGNAPVIWAPVDAERVDPEELNQEPEN